jgi:MFS transporter, MFS domain-containing protein family, molybdate-anion transporter
MTLYLIVFTASVCIMLCLMFRNATSFNMVGRQRIYLSVYTCAYFADWLKGPYLYKLYESYGMTENEMGMLFCVGFISSAIVGPFVGVVADNFGRKKMCLAYFLIYAVAACMCQSQSFSVLLLGRILSGIGTSLLCTIFESWMVFNFKLHNISREILEDTLSKSTVCNSVSAIVAGIVAQISVKYMGYSGPYKIILIPLVCGSLLCFWGFEADSLELHHAPDTLGLQASLKSMDKNVWILCITQSIFLSTMYTFVFLWTPAFETQDLPYGLIFSTFMVMISIGAQLYATISDKLIYLPYGILFLAGGVFLAAALAKNTKILYMSFCGFELICGVMFPSYGALRSIYIDEKYRTTVMNICRIPLNVFVIIMLLNKQYMTIQQTFVVCGMGNIVGGFIYCKFVSNKTMQDSKLYRRPDNEEDFGSLDDSMDEYELESDPEL